jgi:hypothetical protein
MNRNDSRPVLETSGAGDSLAEFNYAAQSLIGEASKDFSLVLVSSYAVVMHEQGA